MLPSLVIKIEYCRALHRGSNEPIRPDSFSCPPSACTPWRVDESPISGVAAAEIPSVSSIAPAFLPGSAKYVECDVTHSKQTTAPFLPGATTAPRGLCQGTPSAVPSLVCPDKERSIQLNYSFRAASSARASSCELSSGVTNLNFGRFPTDFPGAFFATNSVRPRPFLTGSAPQTESSVTHSKQTSAPFLTGARTHIREFVNSHFSAPQNLLLHRRPIQIFLRPTI